MSAETFMDGDAEGSVTSQETSDASSIVKRLLDGLPKDHTPKITKARFGYWVTVQKGMSILVPGKWRITLWGANRAGRRWANRLRDRDARERLRFPVAEHIS